MITHPSSLIFTGLTCAVLFGKLGYEAGKEIGHTRGWAAKQKQDEKNGYFGKVLE